MGIENFSNESIKLKLEIIYSAYFLNEDSRSEIIQHIDDFKDIVSKYPNIIFHHCTKEFKPSCKNNDSFNVGNICKIKIKGYVDDGKVFALLVDKNSCVSNNENPHITVATANDENGKKISPVKSNESISSALSNNSIISVEPFEISVVEGYFDIKRGDVYKKLIEY